MCRDISHAQGASRSQEIETRSFHEEAVKHDRTGIPVVCRDMSHAQGASQTRSSHDSTNFNVEDETNHDRTVKPVVCRDANHERSMLNEVDIDFRTPGLPHSVDSDVGNKLITIVFVNLSRNLQQNKAYNPFSTTSKKMIQDVGNVELFVLFETEPKTQCKESLSYWSQGIVYCTCGHLLKESEANRGAIQCTLDLLSTQNYVIKKGRPHGHRYGKTAEQRDHFIAHNLRKRCIKRHFQGIHHRFVNDLEFRASQLEHDRNEEVCVKMDEFSHKDFRHHMTQAEYF